MLIFVHIFSSYFIYDVLLAMLIMAIERHLRLNCVLKYNIHNSPRKNMCLCVSFNLLMTVPKVCGGLDSVEVIVIPKSNGIISKIDFFLIVSSCFQKTNEGSTEDVFHSPSLPSRSPAGPYHHASPHGMAHPPHPHQQPPPHPHQHPPTHQPSHTHQQPPHQPHPYHPQDDVHDSTPSKDDYHYQRPTAATISTHDPVKGVPPPSYHHRDWSPPTQATHPGQTPDQVNMQDMRRGEIL